MCISRRLDKGTSRTYKGQFMLDYGSAKESGHTRLDARTLNSPLSRCGPFSWVEKEAARARACECACKEKVRLLRAWHTRLGGRFRHFECARALSSSWVSRAAVTVLAASR
eukprot:4134822-Pleurochrysis_carterae.AAC.6